MKRLRRLVLTVLVMVTFTSRVTAHAFLERSEPSVGGEIKNGPEELRIWFTEPIKVGLSTIEVFDAKGKQLDKRDLRLDQANASLVHLSLPKLSPGTYKVVWHATAQDLHVTKGDFTFRVGNGT